MSFRPFRHALAALAVALLVPLSVQAELGGPASGVRGEGARTNATVAAVATPRYTRHELIRANGGSVREFSNPNGQVFAVTWSGPGKPDLRALLGRYFATLQASGVSGGRALHALRRPAQVSQADLQIQTGGHMGWFRGMAYIPSLAPAGFSTGDLTGAQ